MWSVTVGVVLLLASCRGRGLEVEDGLTSKEPEDSNHLGAGQSDTYKSLQELCAAKPAMTCLKLSLIRGLDRLARRPSTELLPGLTIRSDTELQDLSPGLTPTQVDDALLRSLSSLSLTLKVMDGGVVEKIRDLVGSNTYNGMEDIASTGRKKLSGGSSMMMAGLMSGGTMMTLGMSAIAMMAGKALMTALMSLMLSAMSSMKGGGGGGGKTTYEVVHGHDYKHRSLDLLSYPEEALPQPYSPPAAAASNLLVPLRRRR